MEKWWKPISITVRIKLIEVVGKECIYIIYITIGILSEIRILKK